MRRRHEVCRAIFLRTAYESDAAWRAAARQAEDAATRASEAPRVVEEPGVLRLYVIER